MASNESSTIARRFMQAWSAGGEGIVDELAAPDLVVFYSHFPQPVQGIEEFKTILKQTHSSFPDLQLTVDEIIPGDHKIVVHWNYRGTHLHGEVFSIPPAGRVVQVSGITILRIENGKVVEESGLVDNFSLLQQLKLGAP